MSPLFRNQRTHASPHRALWQEDVRVASYRDKVGALHRMVDFARRAGLRSSLRNRLRVSADELMMNALYHAPRDATGGERHRASLPRELAKCRLDPIELRYRCDAKQFAISVRDGFGSFVPEQARRRGLLHVQRAASELIFHLVPGESTEIVALFHRDEAHAS